jgi:hypothetical protein
LCVPPRGRRAIAADNRVSGERISEGSALAPSPRSASLVHGSNPTTPSESVSDFERDPAMMPEDAADRRYIRSRSFPPRRTPRPDATVGAHHLARAIYMRAPARAEHIGRCESNLYHVVNVVWNRGSIRSLGRLWKALSEVGA